MCLCVCLFLGRKSPKKERNPTTGTYRNVAKKGRDTLPTARASADPESTSQTTTNSSLSIRRPPPIKETLPKAARVSADPENYLTNKHTRQSPRTQTKKPAAARVPGVYLTHRHTDGPPKTQKKRYQGQSEYPQTPGSTSNTNMQETL